ncbi:DUF3099 domain-containing protein [Microbacterium sp. DT81.1]|uniref:DUF3099 domain-containing protein n=1 Tax=Microbacterium sp. DT81.1 TaxID=3393413 RepID=UPI003CF185FC
MKSTAKAQSTTSVPRAPHEEAGARFTKYLVTMGIRIACFILMVAITPYGWYTWVFGIGAMVLPYVAVVLANVGQDTHISRAESPFIAIEAPLPPVEPPSAAPSVIRIAEAPPAPTEPRQA